ncbi:MAG: hypothetical protein WC464_00850 [Bdellovibrionales bacterium]
MRTFRYVALLGVVFFSIAAQQADAAVAGQPCNEIGKTQMDDNNRNVVACLYNSYGILKWKATTGGNDVSCTTGKVVMNVIDGVPQCGIFLQDITCPAGKAVTIIKDGVPLCGS